MGVSLLKIRLFVGVSLLKLRFGVGVVIFSFNYVVLLLKLELVPGQFNLLGLCLRVSGREVFPPFTGTIVLHFGNLGR